MEVIFLIETHLKNLDDELILLLKRAGLKMVYVGIESSSLNVLKGIKRFILFKLDISLKKVLHSFHY